MSKLLPILLLFIISLGGVYAQTKDSIIVEPKTEYGECFIRFRINQSLIDGRYMDNAKELLRLRTTFSNILSDANSSADSIVIYVSSSTDGNYYTNQWLTRARTKSLCDYLYREFPKLKNEKVIVTSAPENWSGLRQMIADDTQIPRQSEALNIIDTEKTPNLKKLKLRALDNGATYTYIIRYFAHHLRYGSIRTVSYGYQRDTIDSVQNLLVFDSVPLISPPLHSFEFDTVSHAIPVPLTKPLTISAPVPKFAVKTNLLYLAALCLNVEGEWYFNDKWSLNLDYQYAWWSNKSQHKYYRLAAVSPEVRYWFASKNNFKGHFAGVYVGAGIYEFMARPSNGIQGEFFIAGGVTYGWAFPLNRWMNMELSIGIGYMMSEYRQYYYDADCYVYNDTQRFTYIGPTKAKVSLVFPLHIKKRLKISN